VKTGLRGGKAPGGAFTGPVNRAWGFFWLNLGSKRKLESPIPFGNLKVRANTIRREKHQRRAFKRAIKIPDRGEPAYARGGSFEEHQIISEVWEE